jgi:hypothetical protein
MYDPFGPEAHTQGIGDAEILRARLQRTGSASWCYVAECGDEYASA